MNAVNRAAILAGGASRRMGQPKALLTLEGEPLVMRLARVLGSLFQELIVVTSDDEIARVSGLASVADIFPGKGPLGGIHAALAHFQQPTFCLACDLPFLNPRAIEYLCAGLEDNDAVLPRTGENKGARAEPLHAVYAPNCLPVFEQELQSERARPIERVVEPLQVRFLAEQELRLFDSKLKFLSNINTPDDARKAGITI